MRKEVYLVKYEVLGDASNTRAQTTLMLYGPNESEAIAELKSRGTVGRDKTIIILSITER